MLHLLRGCSFEYFLFSSAMSASDAISMAYIGSKKRNSSNSFDINISGVHDVLVSGSSTTPTIVNLFPFVFLKVAPMAFFPPSFFFQKERVMTTSLGRTILPLPAITLYGKILKKVLSTEKAFAAISCSPNRTGISDI